MQMVAREMNLSETAFLLMEKDGFSLQWFTPVTEVDLLRACDPCFCPCPLGTGIPGTDRNCPLLYKKRYTERGKKE